MKTRTGVPANIFSRAIAFAICTAILGACAYGQLSAPSALQIDVEKGVVKLRSTATGDLASRQLVYNAMLDNALRSLENIGGGVLELEPGAYDFSISMRYDLTRGPLRVEGRGSVLRYGGDGDGLVFHAPTRGNSVNRLEVNDLDLRSTSGKGTGLSLVDLRFSRWSNLRIKGFDVGMEMKNQIAWSEMNHFVNTSIYANRHAIVFTPGALNPNNVSGTESFARNYFVNLVVSGGQDGDSLVLCRGGVYHCVFMNVGGNFSPDHVVNGFLLDGFMRGTAIRNVGFEFGKPGSSVLKVGTMVGAGRPVVEDVDLLGGMLFSSDSVGGSEDLGASTFIGGLEVYGDAIFDQDLMLKGALRVVPTVVTESGYKLTRNDSLLVCRSESDLQVVVPNLSGGGPEVGAQVRIVQDGVGAVKVFFGGPPWAIQNTSGKATYATTGRGTIIVLTHIDTNKWTVTVERPL